MQDFITYYKSLKRTPKRKLNEKLLPKLGFGYHTLWQKIEYNSFKKLEKEEISKFFNEPIEKLFPEPAFQIPEINS